MSDLIQINLRAEREALAAALSGQARKVLSLCRPEDFSDSINQEIFQEIEELALQDLDISIALVCDRLRLNDKYSPDHITFLEHASGILGVNGEQAARQVGELAARRRLSSLLKNVSDELDAGQTDSSEASERITSQIFQIAAPGMAESRPISEVAAEMRLELERLAAGQVSGFTTSLHGVDQALMRVQLGESMIITGPPGSCKSILGQKMILANVKDHGAIGAVYTLEMSASQWFKRAIAMHSHELKNANQLRGTMEAGKSSLSEAELADAYNVTDYLGNLDRRLFIEDKRSGLWEIMEDLHRRVENDGVNIALIDYAQLIHHGDGRNRVADLSAISRTIRAFTLKHNIVTILVAKMSKAGAGAAFRGEEMFGTEIEGSGSFEYDASIVLSMMLKKPELICNCTDQELQAYKDKNNGKPKHKSNEKIHCDDCDGLIRKAPKRLGWISIVKARDGEVDDKMPIIYTGAKLRLEELCHAPQGE